MLWPSPPVLVVMTRGRLVVVTCAALVAFAANSVLCRLALAGNAIDAASFTSIRIVSGALMLLILLRVRSTKPAGGGWVSASMLFLYAACFSFAYLRLNAGTGALLLFGAVQVTMFSGGLLRGEKPSLTEWIGWLLAFGGLVYLVLPGLKAPSPEGAMLMACAGIAWGVYSLRGKGNKDPAATTTQNFLLATPMALLVSIATTAHAHANANGVLWAVLSGGLTSGIGYVLWYSALRSITSISAAIVQLAVPIIAAVGGALVLSEEISFRLMVSAALTLGGVAFAFSAHRFATTSSRI